MEATKLVLAGEDAEALDLLRLVLQRETDMVVVGQARTGGELMVLVTESPVDAVVVDLDAPGQAVPAAVTELSRLRGLPTRLIGFTAGRRATDGAGFASLGPVVRKDEPIGRLLAAIREAGAPASWMGQAPAYSPQPPAYSPATQYPPSTHPPAGHAPPTQFQPQYPTQDQFQPAYAQPTAPTQSGSPVPQWTAPTDGQYQWGGAADASPAEAGPVAAGPGAGAPVAPEEAQQGPTPGVFFLPPVPSPETQQASSQPAGDVSSRPQPQFAAPPIVPPVAAPSIPEPAPLPEVPLGLDATSLTVSAFDSFRALAIFQEALAGLSGVRGVKVRRFHRGTLYALVQYNGSVPLEEKLMELQSFKPQVVSSKPGSIELHVTSSEEPASAPQGT